MTLENTTERLTLDSVRDRPTIPLWPDTGKLLGLGRNATYRAAARGEIPTLKLGSVYRVSVPALFKLLGADGGASE